MSGRPPDGPQDEHSVFNEPHRIEYSRELDRSEEVAARNLEGEERSVRSDDRVEHTVWDEPTIRAAAVNAPSDQLTYERWLVERQTQTSGVTSWLVTLGLVLAAGPWGIVGALSAGTGGEGAASKSFGIVAVAVIGPLTEEITKIAALLWVTEKRPFWFKTGWQILFAGLAGGLAFAMIENLIYLNIYLERPSASLAAWRWVICSALHAGCTTLSAIGICRMWLRSMSRHERPELSVAAPWIVAAVICHGCYNAAVTAAERLDWLPV